MFLDSTNDWGGLNPEHILALRAVTPTYVFTDKAREGYLSAVRGDEELCALAPALFASDLEVITQLPEAHRALGPHLIKLMKIAYDYSIRLADAHVLSL